MNCSWASMFTALCAGISLVEMTILAVVITVVPCAPLVLFHQCEDSVLSLVLFGLVLALGTLLCRLGREGWKILAYIANGMLA